MYHSINFGNKNTYDDWKIVPETRPVVNPPEPKYIYNDIPGANGSLDLTTSLTGHVNYEDRTGSFTFIVLNDYGEWQDRYSEIMNHLHGKQMEMTLEDDPAYYYIGRFNVNEWRSEQHWSKIVIDYRLDPFKYSHTERTITIPLTGSSTQYIIRDVEQLTIPTITTTRSVTITHGGRSRIVRPNVENKNVSFYPNSNGNVVLNLSYTEYESTGTLTIKYRKVRL